MSCCVNNHLGHVKRNLLIYYVLWSIFSNTDFNLKFIINGNTQECMTNKELFEGPVGDYCIARNTIKCLYKSVSG